MLSLHTNAAAMSTQNSMTSTQKALTSSMTKLGSGYRVNSAQDDAAGLQIANRLSAQTRGMQVAQKNTQNGISMLQTAEGALKEVTNILMRMKDLATESANATANQKDRDAMQAEYNELGKEMANIVGNTKFGGETLLAAGSGASVASAGGLLGKETSVNFHIGATSGEVMEFGAQASLSTALADISAVSATFTNAAAGTSVANEVSSQSTAKGKIDALDKALQSVDTFQSALGAAANRLEHTYNNLSNMITNTENAKGRIMNTDYATETSNMTSKQMLMQASTSMLKQSSSMSQMVMSLMQ